MKRNKKLILKILRYVRDNGNDQDPLDIPDCADYDSVIVRYHVELCIQAGFLKELKDGRNLSSIIRIQSLTWQGHEHLDKNCDL